MPAKHCLNNEEIVLKNLNCNVQLHDTFESITIISKCSLLAMVVTDHMNQKNFHNIDLNKFNMNEKLKQMNES